ncbi:flagellar biosynthesis protein FlhF [Bacillus sp. RO2]|uniref:flagellar biosynthesis protein FlhF n=1 Tax=Bacillus sp. RO2 TaxID=2723913 RepID=UPI00145C3DCC|nr:flagellar biosynthesis protein FlhF [Bacillus sp. RO2]NMH74903.1 flagellar biosynthesis protein FlhF [Bacillus sp. RO2]
MKVKKYKAENMQQAMQLVRLELGDDAVILNSKAVKTSRFFGLLSKKGVEVIAAVDEEPSNQMVKTKNATMRPKTEMRDSKETISSPTSKVEQDKLFDSIQEMKKMMKSLTKEKQRDPLLPDFFFQLEEKLLKTDINVVQVEEIMDRLHEKWLENRTLSYKSMLELVEAEVFQSLEEVSFDHNPYKKKFICLVGPTGVGKTTTLAKLAANAALKKGKSIGFITTDTYRIAAIEQLKTYASILEAPIEVCYSAEDFSAAKNKLSHLDVVFIDTAGRNFLNERFVEELKEVLHFKEEMTTFLVLSLTSKLSDMKKITDQFWNVGIHQFIFTKKDETTSVSSMYEISRVYKKGAAFVTDGQNVPEDLIPFTKELMVRSIMEEIQE